MLCHAALDWHENEHQKNQVMTIPLWAWSIECLTYFFDKLLAKHGPLA